MMSEAGLWQNSRASAEMLFQLYEPAAVPQDNLHPRSPQSKRYPERSAACQGHRAATQFAFLKTSTFLEVERPSDFALMKTEHFSWHWLTTVSFYQSLQLIVKRLWKGRGIVPFARVAASQSLDGPWRHHRGAFICSWLRVQRKQRMRFSTRCVCELIRKLICRVRCSLHFPRFLSSLLLLSTMPSRRSVFCCCGIWNPTGKTILSQPKASLPYPGVTPNHSRPSWICCAEVVC